MSATEPKEEIHELFRRNVPEIAAGTVEIVSVARDVGRLCYVAVRSHDPKVNPVEACVGERGARIKSMVVALNHEHFTVVPWHESPECFIRDAVGQLCDVALDPVTRQASITIDRAAMEQLRAQGIKIMENPEIRLVSELTGWRIRIVGNKND